MFAETVLSSVGVAIVGVGVWSGRLAHRTSELERRLSALDSDGLAERIARIEERTEYLVRHSNGGRDLYDPRDEK